YVCSSDLGRGADPQFLVKTKGVDEAGPAHLLEAADRGRRGIEPARDRADDRIRSEEREVVYHDVNHRLAASRARRYMRVASSGRRSRSSTTPRACKVRECAGCSSTARPNAASAPGR